MKRNMMGEALYYLQKGYSLFNAKPDLLSNLGLALYNNNELDSAKMILEECLEMDNQNYKAYNNLGNVMRKIKKHREAIQFYK